jgi:hypothetical protein
LTFAAENLTRCNASGALIVKVLEPLNLKKDSGLLTGLLTQSPQILNLMQGSCHSLLLIHAQLVRWLQENIALQAAYKAKGSFVLP